MNTKGYLFTFEGIDYAGKSTVVKALTQKLIQKGFNVSTAKFYEPGGTPYADLLRSFIKKTQDTEFAQTKLTNLQETIQMTDMSPLGQSLSFFCAREDQFYTKIKAEIETGKIVILDRSVDSTAVYQGHAQNPKLLPWIRQTNALILEQSDLHITQTYLIDITMDERQKRMASRGIDKLDRFESKGDEFAKKIRLGYLAEEDYYSTLPKNDPQHKRIIIIDGCRTTQEIVLEIYEQMIEILTD